MDDMMPPEERVSRLLAIYAAGSVNVAGLLCDRHDRDLTAYTIIAEDLSSHMLSYGELADESRALAGALRQQGIGRGDRVATLMGKSREFLVVLLAIWRVGAVHVPLFTAFAPPAIAERLARSSTKLVVVDPQYLGKLDTVAAQQESPALWVTGKAQPGARGLREVMTGSAPLVGDVSIEGHEPVIEIFTSGTTGSAKAVTVPAKALASFQIYAEYGLGLRSGDRFWNAADPGWGYGLYFGVLASLITGIAGHFGQGSFSPERTWAVLQRFGITNFAAAPTIYRSLMDLAAPVGLTLERCSSAGEPLTADINEWSRSALGTLVHDHYGQTETGMILNNHHHPLLAGEIKHGSMGRALPGWRMTVLAEDKDVPVAAGEIGRIAADLQESPLAWFEGYVGDERKSAEKFSADGRWYLTGDVGSMDDDGDFFFSSRVDDVILMAGYRIGPAEVEAVIARHPAIRSCAVFAVPDRVRGEVLECAVVVRGPVEGDEALERDIQQWVKSRYAAHAYPRRVHFFEDLPTTPSGKIQRFRIRQQIIEQMAATDPGETRA